MHKQQASKDASNSTHGTEWLKKKRIFHWDFCDFIRLKMREFLAHAKAENWDCTVDVSQASNAQNGMWRFKWRVRSYKNDKRRRIYRKMDPFSIFFHCSWFSSEGSIFMTRGWFRSATGSATIGNCDVAKTPSRSSFSARAFSKAALATLVTQKIRIAAPTARKPQFQISSQAS